MNWKNKRWCYLALGIFALLFSGIIYAWSILKVPLAKEFGWSIPQLSLNYTLTMSFFCLGGITGSALNRKYGTRVAIILAALFSCGGLLAASCLTGDSIVYLYLSYGILCSAGIGMAYNTVLSTVCAWFPDKLGLCSGCLMMGFGASAMVIGSVADAMINAPEIGWRMAYAALGIALGFILLITAIFLRVPNQENIQKQDTKAQHHRETLSKDFTTVQMIKSSSFWQGFLHIMFLSAAGSTVISFAKDVSLSAGAGAILSTLLVGILSICNGAGRVATGAAIDRFGQKRIMLIANGTTLAAMTLVLISLIAESVPMCILSLCITGVSYGAYPSISSTLVAKFYGSEFYSTNLSVMGLNLMGAAGIASLAGVLFSVTKSYVAAIVLLICLTVAGLILNLNLWNSKKRGQ